ncbi:MAG: fatty acid desaturase [Bacteroidetes bacterium]|nr:fatty acid desaturase [Bacteroidota bacterium]
MEHLPKPRFKIDGRKLSTHISSDSFIKKTMVRIAPGAEEYPDNFSIYLWSWSQYILYPVIGFFSWWYISSGWAMLWAIPLAFAIYNVWMTGHDACHNSVFLSKHPRLNQAVAFLALDCLSVTQKTWVQTHHKEHHAFPVSSIDGQRLEGNGMIAELWNFGCLALSYIWLDFMDCFKSPTFKKVFTLIIRVAFLISLGWGLPLTLFFLVFFGAYFGLLSHSISTLSNASTFRQIQLASTVDILPGNWFAEFCSGGLNSHAVHHVWPHLPRGLHGWASKQLKVLEPEHYRSFNFIETINFWRNRQNPLKKSELPTPEVYYKKSESVV